MTLTDPRTLFDTAVAAVDGPSPVGASMYCRASRRLSVRRR